MKYSYNKRPTHHRRARRTIVAGVLVATVLLAGCTARYYHRQTSVAIATQPAMVAKATPPKVVPRTVSGTYLFTGTVMYGRAIEKLANGDQNQPFSGMSTLGSFDATTGVLECPVTSGNIDYQAQVSTLRFNCRPEWLPTVKKYFPILNLASNHLEDMGADGYAETQTRLTSAGIQTVGNYNPHAEKDDCKPVIWPVHVQDSNGMETSATLPVAYCSFNYKILFSPAPGELESIAKWSKQMPVIALMNGGPEYMHVAGPAQTSVAHKMIDEGADFVVGDGAHWAQNTEVYKNKLIVYSMGNFIFDQTDEDGRNALNLSVGMGLKYSTNLAKWMALSSTCQTSSESCLSSAAAQNLARLEPTYDFNVIASTGGYQAVTTKANATEQAYIEMRANWSATQAQLKQATALQK